MRNEKLNNKDDDLFKKYQHFKEQNLEEIPDPMGIKQTEKPALKIPIIIGAQDDIQNCQPKPWNSRDKEDHLEDNIKEDNLFKKCKNTRSPTQYRKELDQTAGRLEEKSNLTKGQTNPTSWKMKEGDLKCQNKEEDNLKCQTEEEDNLQKCQNEEEDNLQNVWSSVEEPIQHKKVGNLIKKCQSEQEDKEDNLQKCQSEHEEKEDNLQKCQSEQEDNFREVSNGGINIRNLQKGKIKTLTPLQGVPQHENLPQGETKNLTPPQRAPQKENLPPGKENKRNLPQKGNQCENPPKGEDKTQKLPQGETKHKIISQGEQKKTNISNGGTKIKNPHQRETKHETLQPEKENKTNLGETHHENLPKGQDNKPSQTQGSTHHKNIPQGKEIKTYPSNGEIKTITQYQGELQKENLHQGKEKKTKLQNGGRIIIPQPQGGKKLLSCTKTKANPKTKQLKISFNSHGTSKEKMHRKHENRKDFRKIIVDYVPASLAIVKSNENIGCKISIPIRSIGTIKQPPTIQTKATPKHTSLGDHPRAPGVSTEYRRKHKNTSKPLSSHQLYPSSSSDNNTLRLTLCLMFPHIDFTCKPLFSICVNISV